MLDQSVSDVKEMSVKDHFGSDFDVERCKSLYMRLAKARVEDIRYNAVKI